MAKRVIREKSPPWRAILALILVWLAMLLESSWIWGMLFLYLTLPTLQTGQTRLIDDVDRAETPLLFWAVTGTWLFVSLYFIWIDFHVFF